MNLQTLQKLIEIFGYLFLDLERGLEISNQYIPIVDANIDTDNPGWEDFDGPEQILKSTERAMAHLPRYNTQTIPLIRLGAHVSRVHDELEQLGVDLNTRFYGLAHDNVESYFGDVPRPLKSEEQEERELQMLEGLWPELGIDAPTEEEWDIVMRADDKVLIWEIGNTWPEGDQRETVIEYQFDKHEDDWDYDSTEEIIDELDGRYDLVAGPEESLQMFQDRYQVLQNDLAPEIGPQNYDWNLKMAQEDPNVN